jgi:hypothetical protein
MDDNNVITLVAVERGFALGRMFHPGQTFNFSTKKADGSPRKIPRWAQPADKPLPVKPVFKGDLKPKNAQAAVGKKRGELANGGPADSLA